MTGRWEKLFADVDAQFEAARRAETTAEVADRTRREFALVALVDRLRAAVGAGIRVWLPAGEPLAGSLRSVGPDWLLLADPHEVLVPLAAVTALAGLPARTAVPGDEGPVAGRLGLAYMLRRLTRDRAHLRVLLTGGDTVAGTCDRVGQDFIELAEHLPGERPRPGATRTIPLAALLAVRRA